MKEIFGDAADEGITVAAFDDMSETHDASLKCLQTDCKTKNREATM
jgi:hypothetical protein